MKTADIKSQDRIRFLVHRWFEDVWRVRREASIDEMMAPECRVRVEGVDVPLDSSAFKQYRAAFLNAVPNLGVEMSIIAVEGTTAITSWRLSGTHTGPGLGIPASNGPVHVTGMTRFHFRNDLIVAGADSWNRGEMIASLMQIRMEQICAAADLTMRESQVALLMADRLTHTEIAAQLNIAPNTARRHCEQVLRKLQLRSRRQVGPALGRIFGAEIPGHGES